MRLAYAGTPAFAVAPLEALVAAGHSVTGVWTQPDRPAGRGMQSQPSPVKQWAVARGIAVHQPESLRSSEALEALRVTAVDALIVVAYGLLLPKAVLEIFPLGAINVHASLLPRWRGAAPIQRALLAGDTQTGVCIMRMDEGLDTGPVLRCESLRIEASDTSGSLHDKLSALGAHLLPTALADLASGQAQAQPQPSEGACYAAKIDKREARVDWRQPAAAIERRIRAFNPIPGAVSALRDGDVKLWRAALREGKGSPGTVLQLDPLLVACGSDAVELIELQRAGGKRLSAAEFARGIQLQVGDRFDAGD